MPVRILLLAANPTQTSKLSLDEEAREIELKIRQAEFRDKFQFRTQWAVRPDDIIDLINSYNPHILHFSGHGPEKDGIILRDRNGAPKVLRGTGLKQLLTTVQNCVRLVAFNACFSSAQARLIADSVGFAIGTPRAISDDVAIYFAASFYRALAYGRSVRDSFQQGLVAIRLEIVGRQINRYE